MILKVRGRYLASAEIAAYDGNHRPLLPSAEADEFASLPFIVSGRCGLLIASFHGDGAPS
jgi:hypothetical protein